MRDGPPTDPVLARFRAELEVMYGDTLERVVLFGSRARGDAREDSDYDVAVFLKGMTDRWPEAARLAELTVRIFDESEALIHPLPFRAGYYDERTPLMREIRQEGVDL